MAGLQAERIGDVEEGHIPEPTDQLNEQGLTPEEQQAFDEMRDADRTLPKTPEEGADAPGPDTGEHAPPAPAQPKPEPEEDDEPDQVIRDPRTGREQRTISYGKHQRLLKQARADNEAFRAQLEEGRISQAKLAERLAILNDALMAPPPPRELTPQEQEYARQQQILQNPMLEQTIDPNIDLAASIAQMQRRQIFMMNSSMQQQEDTQDQLSYQNMVRDYTNDTNRFTQTAEGQHFFGPEGAYQFLKNSRLLELSFALFEKDPRDPNERFTQAEVDQIINEFNNEERQLVSDALQNRRSPARSIMRYAQARGWRPPQPQQQQPAPPTRVPVAPRSGGLGQNRPAVNGLAPGMSNGLAPRMPSAVAQIQAEMAGANASRSLSDGGGSPPGEPLSMERLLHMNDEEFGIYVDNMPKSQLDAIMGRDFSGRY